MSSLQPLTADENVEWGPLDGHVILFEHANFRGEHKHVFQAEPNLDAPEDNYFNDRVSSIAVIWARWEFFRRPNFVNLYPSILAPAAALYPWVEDLGIQNDDISSLRPAYPPAVEPGWVSKPTEFSAVKYPAANRSWRVIDKNTGRGYYILSGAHDGIADAFSDRDIWVVRYRGDEDRSGRQGDEWSDGLNAFVNGESIDGQDIVVWYCGHLYHRAAEGGDEWHQVGPVLAPFGNW